MAERAFPQTRHSLLAAIRDGDEGVRRRALDVLTEAYWRPVYGYLRLRWKKPHEDAADLTQEFFAALLHRDLLAEFDPQRARLRTFLRLCIDGLARNQERSARRRGPLIELDFAEARGELDAAAPSAESPEALFEKQWAKSVFALALRRLEERCGREKAQYFQVFKDYELSPDPPDYKGLARRHRISTSDVTNRLAWARRELRTIVLEVLRDSTASDEEFRAEARALLGIDPP